jgi:tetratricopeptide (TPR) repeat protein
MPEKSFLSKSVPQTNSPYGISARTVLLIVLSVVAVLRIVHFANAMQSPLTYQLGPDENYYLRFARDVAFGSGGMTAEFAFMDPLYGYLLGWVLRFSGGSVFPMYVLQIVVDCGTAYALCVLGRELGRPRVGVLAALMYAFIGPAMAFSTMLLKATWVAAYVAWWMVAVLRTIRSRRKGAWILMGIYCGIGIALRANLLLLVALVPMLVALLRDHRAESRHSMVWCGSAWLFGLAVPLLLLGWRNSQVSGGWSPLPNNGGIVLHQLYNAGNPQSRQGAPTFVRYGEPGEIWHGYAAEAERRFHHSLTPAQVDHYWRGEAERYMRTHVSQSLGNAMRKLREFCAYPEQPNNRSYEDERLFSPVLRILPQPFGWLLALGLPGLLWFAWRDRRGMVLLAPVAVGVFTIMVFFAEDRFRFNIIAPFVFGAAIWLAQLAAWWRTRHWSHLAMSLLISAALGIWSVVQARSIPETPTNWQRIVWGYLNSGRRAEAERWLSQASGNPQNAGAVDVFRGYLALQDHDYPAAILAYQHALPLGLGGHESWHKYSLALEHEGQLQAALAAELQAWRLGSDLQYLIRIADLLRLSGQIEDARQIYQQVAANPQAGKWRQQAEMQLREIPAPSKDSSIPAR